MDIVNSYTGNQLITLGRRTRSCTTATNKLLELLFLSISLRTAGWFFSDLFPLAALHAYDKRQYPQIDHRKPHNHRRFFLRDMQHLPDGDPHPPETYPYCVR